MCDFRAIAALKFFLMICSLMPELESRRNVAEPACVKKSFLMQNGKRVQERP